MRMRRHMEEDEADGGKGRSGRGSVRATATATWSSCSARVAPYRMPLLLRCTEAYVATSTATSTIPVVLRRGARPTISVTVSARHVTVAVLPGDPGTGASG
eukprot:1926182-Rhodomonas_salina.2